MCSYYLVNAKKATVSKSKKVSVTNIKGHGMKKQFKNTIIYLLDLFETGKATKFTEKGNMRKCLQLKTRLFSNEMCI